jgi:thermitase
LGHGTAVAGVAGAAGNNAIGVAGVSWKNPIMPLVVLNSSDYASYSNIASAIIYAADHGARVINVSIAGTSSSSTLQSAVNYAWTKGSVVFAAAGNSSSSTPNYPAACNNVVAISATDSTDHLTSFSSYGSWVDLSAPGIGMVTTNRGGGYGNWWGTSFSAPATAGVAALVLSVNPGLSADALVTLLKNNSDDLGVVGFDTTFGAGRINAAKAVAAAQATMNVIPTVTISSPAAGSTVSGSLTVSGAAQDSLGITQVSLACDGIVVATGTSANFAFSWNPATVAVGSHTLTVRATNSAGNSASSSVAVSVAAPPPNFTTDLTAPSVQITSPNAGGALVNLTKISVNALDNVGVSQVSIYVDGTLVYTGTAAPYTYSWNTNKVTAGTHTISAKAWDAAGNSGSAASVSVYK